MQLAFMLLPTTIGTSASHAVGAPLAKMPASSGAIDKTEFDNPFVLDPHTPVAPALLRLNY